MKRFMSEIVGAGVDAGILNPTASADTSMPTDLRQQQREIPDSVTGMVQSAIDNVDIGFFRDLLSDPAGVAYSHGFRPSMLKSPISQVSTTAFQEAPSKADFLDENDPAKTGVDAISSTIATALSPIATELSPNDDELPVVAAARGGEMPKQAQQLANQGRYGDTMLVHMNPREMAGIASLAPNRSISTNPQTGLPEMFDFMDVLPTIAGIGASFFLGPIGAAAVSGLTTAMTTKDIGKGVMAGLMSYGLGSLMGAGSESAAQAATAADAAAQTATDTAMATGQQLATASVPGTGALMSYGPNLGGAYGPGGLDPRLAGFGSGVAPTGGVIPTPAQNAAAYMRPPMQLGPVPVETVVNPNISAPVANPGLSAEVPGKFDFMGRVPRTGIGYDALSGEAMGTEAARNYRAYASQMGEGIIPAHQQALAAQGTVPIENVSPLQSIQSGQQLGPPSEWGPRPSEMYSFDRSAAPPPDTGGILGGIGEDISDTAEMITDRTYWDLADTPGYVDDDAARALGFRSVRDLAGPAMYAGMGAVGTIAPLLEEGYEYPTRDKRTYAPTRQISPSEYRVPSSPPIGYDAATEGEWSYYGNRGGIVNNLPMIYAKRGYGGEQVSDVLAQVVSQQSPIASPSQAKPTPAQPPQPAQEPRKQAMQSPPNIQAHLQSFMPSAYAEKGTTGGTAKALSDQKITEAIETARAFGAPENVINQTKTSDLPALAARYKSMSTEGFPNITDDTGQRYLPEAIFKKQDGGPAGSPVRPEEIMGAEEVATVGIMAGAPDVVQEGVRGEASIMNPTDPQNAEERAIYDKAVLALEGELEPSDAQNAVDEYIEVFGAEAYRSLKKVVDKTRETGGVVKPANGESTVPNGELQGEDVIAGKIVDPMTGAETANLRVGENEYIKTGKDLAYAAAARGLPPTPENGAMVEGMEEEALRRAFG